MIFNFVFYLFPNLNHMREICVEQEPTDDLLNNHTSITAILFWLVFFLESLKETIEYTGLKQTIEK